MILWFLGTLKLVWHVFRVDLFAHLLTVGYRYGVWAQALCCQGFAWVVTVSDVVLTVTFDTETETWLKLRDRDFIKNSRVRDFKICALCRNLFKTCCHHFWVEFVSNFWHFPTCFGGFLPASATNNKSANYRNLLNHFFAIFKVLRPATKMGFKTSLETETKSRDSITDNSVSKHSWNGLLAANGLLSVFALSEICCVVTWLTVSCCCHFARMAMKCRGGGWYPG